MEHLVVKLKPDVQRLERDIMPIIDQMERAEQRWQRMRNSLSEQQKQMVKLRGYVPLTRRQRHILFPVLGQAAGCSSASNETEFVCSTEESTAEREFEQNIAELAEMKEGDPLVEHKLDMFFSQDDAKQRPFRQEKRRRRKRQEEGGLAPDTEEGGHEIPRTVVLEPFAFDTRLGGVVLEGIYLSPTAFYKELASPEVLTAQILTPQLLDAFVLSPEAFMAEVLSPLVAEGRVLAPRTLFVQILGPTAGALHIGSPDTHGILVLSPHILSPRIYSEERYLIEVLSPHFLGGEHEKGNEEDTHVHFGGTVRFVGWPGHSPLGETEQGEKHEQEQQKATKQT
ncbi:hypothetical protein niasHS_014478 [Heterodera schachtii]|uniref:Uncharacterized protein n=1 Tax=Heterodera schachtii TaxID=97005 RepID=A0ABD2IBF6_HETSC